MVLMSKHFLFAILQGAFVLLSVLVQAQDQAGLKAFISLIMCSKLVILLKIKAHFVSSFFSFAGFISIDCGTSGKSSYTDEETGITYLSDSNFAETGENRDVSAAHKLLTDEKQLWNVRSFPEGTRNCYTLKPSQGKGTRYLIRARFMYGNYNNESTVPEFDLYVGANLWDTVVIKYSWTIINKEIIYVPSSDYIHVCLVNTGLGVPFISVLELRPLNNETYVSTEGPLQLYKRYDFASSTDRVMR